MPSKGDCVCEGEGKGYEKHFSCTPTLKLKCIYRYISEREIIEKA